MKKVILSVMFIAVFTLFAGSAFAATETASLNVTVNVQAACSVSTTEVNFGTFTGDAVIAEGNVSVQCPIGTLYDIALGGGLHYGAAWERQVSDGTYYLYYYLYKDSGRSVQWGDSDYDNTCPRGSSLTDTANGASQPHAVYGRMDGVGYAPALGTYSDTVIVTVYY